MGKLNRDQFALAMHLIQSKIKGQPLPNKLTPAMLPPSARRNSLGVLCHLFLPLCVCLSIHPSPHPSVIPSIYLSIHLFLSIYLFIHLSSHPIVSPSIRLHIYLPPSIQFFIHPFPFIYFPLFINSIHFFSTSTHSFLILSPPAFAHLSLHPSPIFHLSPTSSLPPPPGQHPSPWGGV